MACKTSASSRFTPPRADAQDVSASRATGAIATKADMGTL